MNNDRVILLRNVVMCRAMKTNARTSLRIPLAFNRACKATGQKPSKVAAEIVKQLGASNDLIATTRTWAAEQLLQHSNESMKLRVSVPEIGHAGPKYSRDLKVIRQNML